MKQLLAATAAVALLATALTPAVAANSQLDTRTRARAESARLHHDFAADPSFGNRAGIDYAKHTGRCVADLGYGRFEYCGW